MNKKKFIIAGLITAVLVIGGFLYWNYTTSPKYSILQVKDAWEEHDYALFEQYVDIEGVMTGLVDQALEIYANTSTPPDAWEQLGQNLGTGFLNILKPQIGTLYKQQIKKWVETGKFETDSISEGVSYSISDVWKHWNIENITGIEYVEEEGKIAYVGIGIRQERFDTLLILPIKMRDKGNYWQVAELLGLSKFQKTIEELEDNRVAAINKPIKAEMYNSLIIRNNIKTSYSSDDWSWNKTININFEVQNISEKVISEYSASVNLSSENFEINKVYNFYEDNNKIGLWPQQFESKVWQIEVNRFSDEILFTPTKIDLLLTLTIYYIKFSDGTTLHLQDKWEAI